MQCEKAAFQNTEELKLFIELIRRENVQRYLEIGSAHGGSLWRIGLALPEGSQIVSVDLPFKDNAPVNLEECCATLRRKGRNVTLIVGDSADRNVIDRVANFAPFDLCFIDGNHTKQYVSSDWMNYGPMARIVAFHDISYHKPEKIKMYVPRFWNEIKGSYRHREIRLCPSGDNGIGVLWRS